MWVYLVASCRDWSRLCSSHLASRIGRDRTRLYQCNEYRHRVVPLRHGPPDAVDAVGDRSANQRTRRYNSYAETRIDAAVRYRPDGRESGAPRLAGRCSRQPGVPYCALVASTAWTISWVAASGCETNETCEDGTGTIVAFARSAMNCCSAGGIALSWVPSRYQQGSVFHAGGADGVA